MSNIPIFKSPDSYRRFAREVCQTSRYKRDSEDQEFLETLRRQAHSELRTVLAKGTVLWRAQPGHSCEPTFEGNQYIGDFPAPHEPQRMKPLLDRAKEGRANPKGISYLYLATQKQTALSEVRPSIGELVSLAQFEIIHDLTIADCSREGYPRSPSEKFRRLSRFSGWGDYLLMMRAGKDPEERRLARLAGNGAASGPWHPSA